MGQVNQGRRRHGGKRGAGVGRGGTTGAERERRVSAGARRSGVRGRERGSPGRSRRRLRRRPRQRRPAGGLGQMGVLRRVEGRIGGEARGEGAEGRAGDQVAHQRADPGRLAGRPARVGQAAVDRVGHAGGRSGGAAGRARAPARRFGCGPARRDTTWPRCSSACGQGSGAEGPDRSISPMTASAAASSRSSTEAKWL